jgi:cysteine desulfurase / selenocysteine lyase
MVRAARSSGSGGATGARASRTASAAPKPSAAVEGGLQGRRKDFPILARTFHGKSLVYLDSAATSQKPHSVIAAEEEFYSRLNANVHRGVYALSEEATEAYEGARARVARFLGAKDPEEIIFVRGTTEALNLAAVSLSRTMLQKGDRVVSTEMEHHSNIVPWHLLRASHGIQLDFVGITDGGRLVEADLERLVSRGTKVFTFTHVSNVLGTVNPVRELADRAHDAGALAILDAAQSAPHLPLDVGKLGVDLLAFSGHKVLGPTGIGVLWGRKELLAKMAPYMGGGEMISEVGKTEITYKDPPYRFEAGTPNVAGAVVLRAALDYLSSIGWEELHRWESGLLEDAYRRLLDALDDKITFYGPSPKEGRESLLSFALKGVHPHDVATLLDAEGIAVRAGHHCAQLIMKRYQVPALSRASYYLYNTKSDTERLVAALTKVSDVLGR